MVYTRRAKALWYALLGAGLTGFLVIAALIGPTDLSGYRGSWFARLLVYLGTVLLFLLTVYALFLASPLHHGSLCLMRVSG